MEPMDPKEGLHYRGIVDRALAAPKIIQVQPWRDLLLGLTDDGQIFRLTWIEGDRFASAHFICDSTPVFPGLPRSARRP